MMDLQLFGGVVKSLFGIGGGSSASQVAAPSVKTAAPGSVATQTAEDVGGSRYETQRRLRRGLNSQTTDKTQGALSPDASGQMKKQLLGA